MSVEGVGNGKWRRGSRVRGCSELDGKDGARGTGVITSACADVVGFGAGEPQTQTPFPRTVLRSNVS